MQNKPKKFFFIKKKLIDFKNTQNNKGFSFRRQKPFHRNNKKFIFKLKRVYYLKNNENKKNKKNYRKNNTKKYSYLYKNKNLKKAIFLKKPKYDEIIYPFFLNMKLINEYLKKK